MSTTSTSSTHNESITAPQAAPEMSVAPEVSVASEIPVASERSLAPAAQVAHGANPCLGYTQPIEIKVLDERLRQSEFGLPRYESAMAAGVDLRAMLQEDTVLAPQGTLLVPTGIALNMGNSNLCATVLPRSGLGFKNGIVLGNLTGLIDADYQGELMVPIWNRSSEPFTITVGMRIAQMVFLPIIRVAFTEVESFTPTVRGTAGFGSTSTH